MASIATLAAPISGQVVALGDIPDPVFSSGVMGKGCGVRPEGETVLAPLAGVVTAVTPTEHAVGITASDGTEILIHVGIDTVEMNGDGFATLVGEGDRVEEGDPVIAFVRSKIKNAGHEDIVILVVPPTSSKHEVTVCASGSVSVGDALCQVA